MFSVYGSGGRVFRGSLEQMRDIGPISAVGRMQGIEPLGIDARDGPASQAASLIPHPPSDVAHRIALDSYAQTQKGLRQRQPITRVAALMSPKVITLDDRTNVHDAWQRLSQEGINQAPVVDHNKVLVGLFSRTQLLTPENLDLPEISMAAWRALLNQRVADLMWTPVPSVSPDTDIRRVASVLLDTALPGLAVADEEGTVVGFISRSDILRAVVADPPLDLWG
jgi:predicted transcriptional regulator